MVIVVSTASSDPAVVVKSKLIGAGPAAILTPVNFIFIFEPDVSSEVPLFVRVSVLTLLEVAIGFAVVVIPVTVTAAESDETDGIVTPTVTGHDTVMVPLPFAGKFAPNVKFKYKVAVSAFVASRRNGTSETGTTVNPSTYPLR